MNFFIGIWHDDIVQKSHLSRRSFLYNYHQNHHQENRHLNFCGVRPHSPHPPVFGPDEQSLLKLFNFFQIFTLFNPVFNILGACKLNPVLCNWIPDKGSLLTKLPLYWQSFLNILGACKLNPVLCNWIPDKASLLTKVTWQMCRKN